MWCRTGDPVRDADDFLHDQESRYKRFLDRCPECAICGMPIVDDRCVSIDPYSATQTTICNACKVDELEKATKALNPYIVEILADALDDLVKDTPREVA